MTAPDNPEFDSGFPASEAATFSKPALEIALALVWKGNLLLITRRRPGVHLGDFWEFPGGKRKPGETFAACAEREVLEEVGVNCRAERIRSSIRHDYPDRSVELTPVDCVWLSGEPRCIEVDAWAWVEPGALSEYRFPEANLRLLAALASNRA